MIIISSIGRSSKSSSNSRSSNCSSAVAAAVVEAITRSRNFSISSSSGSSSGNSSISTCIFTLSLLKNSNSDGGDNSKKYIKGPKTSDHNSNATPFKELQCFDALSLGRAQVDIKKKLCQLAHIAYLSH